MGSNQNALIRPSGTFPQGGKGVILTVSHEPFEARKRSHLRVRDSNTLILRWRGAPSKDSLSRVMNYETVPLRESANGRMRVFY